MLNLEGLVPSSAPRAAASSRHVPSIRFICEAFTSVAPRFRSARGQIPAWHPRARSSYCVSRYRAELRQHSQQLDRIRALAKTQTVTLVYSAHDQEHVDAIVLKCFWKKRGLHEMPKRFQICDHVSWNSEAGRVSETIIAIHTSDFDYKGHLHHASEDDPQYEIKSDKTDHIAAHKGSALNAFGRGEG